MTSPTSPGRETVEARWRQALDPGPACLAPERLGQPLTAAEQAHVQGCARCQTELEMFAAFEASAPVEGEGLAVPWISAETRRRLEAERRPAAPAATPAPSRPGPWRLPLWALMAASIVLAVGGGLLLYTPEPAVDPAAPGAPVYRGERIEITTAVGDVDAAPATLAWRAVSGAVGYEVRLLEVDGTELWRFTTSSPAVTVPAEALAAFRPARTLVWRIEAKDASGAVLAGSGDVRMRVRVPGTSGTGR